MNAGLEKLLRILDENFIMYKVYNKGTHYKIWDSQKEKWINYYISSGKVHYDGEKSTGKGVGYLLQLLGLEFNIKDQVEITLIKGSVERLSNKMLKINKDSIIRLGVNSEVSILCNNCNDYKYRIGGDFIEIVTNSEDIVISTSSYYVTEQSENGINNTEEIEI